MSGTFSYDTTSQAADAETGLRTFLQNVHGGYNLDINNGAIQLSASDYVVTVANDFQRTPEDVDLFIVDYQSRFIPAPLPILVNGAAWGGTTAFIKVELSWLSATFTDPDEPTLTPDRPLTPSPGISAFVGSDMPRLFSINSISTVAPLAGDYNRDGQLNPNDYAEWRRAYGEMSEAFLYADGNSDGLVDAADYVIWRNAIASDGAFLVAPEPRSFVLMAAGLCSFAEWFRKRKQLTGMAALAGDQRCKRDEPQH